MRTPTLADVLTTLTSIMPRVEAGTAAAADLEAAVEAAIAAAEQIEGWRGAEALAKRIIGAGLEASGTDRLATRDGSAVMRGKPVMVRSFDATALDALCASYPDAAAILRPHRREHLRAGSLRIVRGASGHGGKAANGRATNGAAVNGAQKVGAR